MTTYTQIHRAPIAPSRTVGGLSAWLRNVTSVVSAVIARIRPDHDLETIEREFGRQGLGQVPLRPFDAEWETFRLLRR